MNRHAPLKISYCTLKEERKEKLKTNIVQIKGTFSSTEIWKDAMFLVFVPVRSLVISLSLKADPRRDSSTVAFDIRFVCLEFCVPTNSDFRNKASFFYISRVLLNNLAHYSFFRVIWFDEIMSQRSGECKSKWQNSLCVLLHWDTMNQTH